MTDEQIIDEVVVWMYEVHYPAPAPVGGHLKNGYECDERRKWGIITQIEDLRLAELYDRRSGSDMKLTAQGLRAAKSGKPLQYLKQLSEQSKNHLIRAENVIYNSGSMTVNDIQQTSYRREGLTNNQSAKNAPDAYPKAKSSVWDKISSLAKIATGLGAIAGLIKVITELINS